MENSLASGGEKFWLVISPVVKQWNGIKETNKATGSDKEWQNNNNNNNKTTKKQQHKKKTKKKTNKKNPPKNQKKTPKNPQKQKNKTKNNNKKQKRLEPVYILVPVKLWLGKLTAPDIPPLGWQGRKTPTQNLLVLKPEPVDFIKGWYVQMYKILLDERQTVKILISLARTK